jgi:hypothetical protein
MSSMFAVRALGVVMADQPEGGKSRRSDRPKRPKARRRKASRSGWKVANWTLATAGIVSAVHWWWMPYLRSHGVFVPTVHIPHSFLQAIVWIMFAYVAAQLALLIAAVVSVKSPDAREWFTELMVIWPCALLAGIVFVMTRRLPLKVLPRRGGKRSLGSGTSGENGPEHREAAVESSQDTDQELLKQNYRQALLLLFDRVERLQGSDELIDLLLKELVSRASSGEEGHQEPVDLKSGTISGVPPARAGPSAPGPSP